MASKVFTSHSRHQQGRLRYCWGLFAGPPPVAIARCLARVASARVASPVRPLGVEPEWVRRMREQQAASGTRFAVKDLTSTDVAL